VDVGAFSLNLYGYSLRTKTFFVSQRIAILLSRCYKMEDGASSDLGFGWNSVIISFPRAFLQIIYAYSFGDVTVLGNSDYVSTTCTLS
jgi:hypothetical protein